MAIRPRPVADKLPPPDWPDPIIEANFDFTNEWCPEANADGTAVETNAMSPEANTAAWQWSGNVSWNRLYACIQSALGVNWVSYEAGVPKLNRVLPLRHPIWPTYYCTNISAIRGYNQRGTWDSLFDADADPDGSISALPDFMDRMADDFGVYERAQVTLQFTPRTYPMWPDIPPFFISAGGGGVPPMVNQYVTQFTDTGNIVLTMNEGIFVWQEGPGSTTGPLPIPLVGNGGPSPVDVKTNKIIETAILHVLWHRVPLEWAYDPKRLLVNSSRLQGCVNKTRFRGFNQQVLRALAPKSSPWRVEPCICRNQAWPTQYSTDVEMLFQYVEPVPGIEAHAPGANGLYPSDGELPFAAGHNLAIYRDFKYYGITTAAAAQGNVAPNIPLVPLNEMAELAELFAHWSAGPGF